MYTSRLNVFKQKTSKLESELSNKISLHKDIQSAMWDNLDDIDLNNCRKNWADLDDNRENICNIIEQHKKSTSDILSLLEIVIKKLENMEALSIYRDFISDFFEEIEARLDPQVWTKVRAAINRKIRLKKVDFRRDEKECISELQRFLQEINMTVEDIELMLLFKKRSNAEFHLGERLEPEEVRENFETSFPEDLKDFKDSFRKAFNAIDNWDQD